MQVEHELQLVKIEQGVMPVFTLNFSEYDAEIMEEFKPTALLLVDHGDDVALMDGADQEFITIKKNQQWIDTAITMKLFVMTIRMPAQATNGIIGRVLVVAFPFGRVLGDSGAFETTEYELEVRKLLDHPMQKSATNLVKLILKNKGTDFSVAN